MRCLKFERFLLFARLLGDLLIGARVGARRGACCENLVRHAPAPLATALVEANTPEPLSARAAVTGRSPSERCGIATAARAQTVNANGWQVPVRHGPHALRVLRCTVEGVGGRGSLYYIHNGIRF